MTRGKLILVDSSIGFLFLIFKVVRRIKIIGLIQIKFGLVMGPGVNNYLKNLPEAASQLPSSVFENDEKRWKERFSDISSMKGSENPYALHSELAEAMISNVLIVRENDKLQSTLDVIEDIESSGTRLQKRGYFYSRK